MGVVLFYLLIYKIKFFFYLDLSSISEIMDTNWEKNHMSIVDAIINLYSNMNI